MKKSDQGKKMKAFYPLQAPNGNDTIVKNHIGVFV
jgi:hypothetical protein